MRAGLLLAGAAITGAFVVAAAPSASAAPSTQQVAVVVAGVGAACVDWQEGMSGADVLEAEFVVTWNTDLLGGRTTPRTIKDKDDPAQPQARAWAYWHDTGSGWTSATGTATGAHPQPGTVEGWSYQGAPPATTFQQVCGTAPSPPPSSPTGSRTATPSSGASVPTSATPSDGTGATTSDVPDEPTVVDVPGDEPEQQNHPSGTYVPPPPDRPATSAAATASWVGFTPTPTVVAPATAPPAVPMAADDGGTGGGNTGPQPGKPAADTLAAVPGTSGTSSSAWPVVIAVVALVGVAGAGGTLAFRNRKG